MKISICFLYLCFTCLTFTNCKKAKESKHASKTYIIDSVNSFEVIKLKTKIDKNGDPQCEKYFKFETNNNGFNFYGGNMVKLFSILRNLDEKQIVCTLDSCNNFYDIQFNGSRNSKNDSIILDRIFELNGLKKVIDVEEVNGFSLHISSKNKIDKFLSNSHKNPNIYLNKDKYILQNTSLKVLQKHISTQFEMHIEENTNSTTKKYNFIIPTAINKNELIQYLNTEYGILLKPKKLKIEKVTIIKDN